MAKLVLPTVTLCAATSVNVDATIKALQWSMEQADFAACLLFTDADLRDPPSGITAVPIGRMQSARAYSHFMLGDLAGHIRTPHCLVIQWDGFVIDAGGWDDSFLNFDYVGAPWPQFNDAHDVGNGGFSLRSRKLLEACRDADFQGGHPEDLVICRTNRRMLEERHGTRFADRVTAGRFAFERTAPRDRPFGFHGIFNLERVIGLDRFWDVYETLDDPRSAFVDYWLLMRQLGHGRDAWKRRWKLTRDFLSQKR